MKFTVTTFALLAVLSVAPIGAATPEDKLDARNAPLDFLADLPALKGVSMRISEAAFLDLLKSQGLSYTRQTKGNETSYMVEVKKDAIILFSFQAGRCMGVQRGNGATFG